MLETVFLKLAYESQKGEEEELVTTVRSDVRGKFKDLITWSHAFLTGTGTKTSKKMATI